MSYRLEGAYAFLMKVKAAFPSIKVVAGGPHVIAIGKALFEDCPAVDIACAGEGEEMTAELLKGSPLESIRGILYRAGGEIFQTPRREFLNSIDHLPFSSWMNWNSP